MTWLKTRLFAVLSALTAILAVLGAVYGKGRRDTNLRRHREDLEDYRNERKRQDDLDVGYGASDAERIRMLNEIANRHSKRAD